MILILCTGNSCRSIMAEYYLRKAIGDSYEVASAGSNPGGKINPYAQSVLEEVGFDLSGATSEHMNDYLDRNVKVVITVCGNADQACPSYPGQVTRYHWPFYDPSHFEGSEEEKWVEFRKTREEIERVFTAYGRGLNDAESLLNS